MALRTLREQQRGLTLLEFIVSMSVMVITISMAIPAFSEIVQSYKSQTVIRQLYGLIQKSRKQAISLNSRVLLCKSNDLVHCGGSWKDGIIVFVDRDNNRAVNGDDILLRSVLEPFEEGELFWRSFRNRSYLEFLPSGRTNYQNGTFTYCIDPSDLEKARGISLTVTGRSQIAFDRNGDGIRENSSGKPLRC